MRHSRSKSLMNPLLCLLYNVFLCLAFCAKRAAATYGHIVEHEFFIELNTGACDPCASRFILVEYRQDQVLPVSY